MSFNADNTGTGPVTHIASRSNPIIKTLRKLAHESTAYRKEGLVWLEGDHLCRAAKAKGVPCSRLIFTRF